MNEIVLIDSKFFRMEFCCDPSVVALGIGIDFFYCFDVSVVILCYQFCFSFGRI